MRGDERVEALAQLLMHLFELGVARCHEPVLREIHARARSPLAQKHVLRHLGHGLVIVRAHRAVDGELELAVKIPDSATMRKR